MLVFIHSKNSYSVTINTLELFKYVNGQENKKSRKIKLLPKVCFFARRKLKERKWENQSYHTLS